jgi:Family of unknown function (DUF6519)
MTIRNDATRLRIVTKDPRRSRAVVARQGQVLLDTDFDQQSRHHLERIEIETVDSLGSPDRLVVPEGNFGFNVTPSGTPANFDIGGGRGYLDGWLLENPGTCKLSTQPHPRANDTVNVPAIIAVKALVRHIDPVEDPVLADTALGDAQASGRALNDWQVFPFVVPGGGAVTCANIATNSDWQKIIAPSTGTLAAMVQATAPSTDPCSLSPGGGYTRLENLLYRVEVHGGDVKTSFPTIEGQRFNLDELKLKLSRRNASTLVRITGVAGTDITVAPPMLDARNWFAPGLYAEIVSIHDDVDPRAAFANERLFRVAQATDDRVTLEAAAADITATAAAADGNWFLRLWDSFPNGNGIFIVSAGGGASESAEIDLGDGVKIKLGGGPNGTFRRGDYWTFAARADGTIDWPMAGSAAQLMSPHGPEIRYAPIAALGGSGTSPVFEDCRIAFATLTDRTLLYRGGDGQSVFAPAGSAMVTLPSKLRVAVMRGEIPVVGAAVHWSLFPGATPCQINGTVCSAGNPITTVTGSDGLAEVDCAIDSNQALALHRVQAAIDPNATGSGPPPVIFSATFDTAAHTGYTPGKCNYLMNTDNVQDALDTLCSKISEPRALNLTSLTLLDASGSSKAELIKDKLILNALDVPFPNIVGGIGFGFGMSNIDSGKPDIEMVPFDPVVEVELDLPYPMTDAERIYWAKVSTTGTTPGIIGPFGFQRVRLDGTVTLVDKGSTVKTGGLMWTPAAGTVRFLNTVPQHLWGQKINSDAAEQLKALHWEVKPLYNRIVCRIRLRSAMIWINDPSTKERIYLNAECLGVRGPITRRELLATDRDPQRAADLDIFIYLTPDSH